MIGELLANTATFSLPALLLIVFVFGFAPGFCMRLLLMLYPRTDPRRAELYAELKAAPRIERPLWVAEQLETALFEGIPARRRAFKARKQRSKRKGFRTGPSVRNWALHDRPLADGVVHGVSAGEHAITLDLKQYRQHLGRVGGGEVGLDQAIIHLSHLYESRNWGDGSRVKTRIIVETPSVEIYEPTVFNEEVAGTPWGDWQSWITSR